MEIVNIELLEYASNSLEFFVILKTFYLFIIMV